MATAPRATEWAPDSWQRHPTLQQPVYKDREALDRAVRQLQRLPPIVVSWEVDELMKRLALAQQGHAFVLQGGDCAEAFDDCDSDRIVQQLKVLLQMSLVLVHGLRKPIVRIGGQYAKPRSSDTETKDGVTLPAYRCDDHRRLPSFAAPRAPDPELLL